MSAFILRSHDSRSAHILTENKHAAHVKVFFYIYLKCSSLALSKKISYQLYYGKQLFKQVSYTYICSQFLFTPESILECLKESLCKKHNYFKFRIYVYVYKGPKRAFSRLRISQKQRQMSSLLVGGRYCRNRDIAQGDMKKIMGDMKKIMGDMKKIMGVLSKTFLQFILAAKSLVQHSSHR